ncbi:Wadjet anti-phage system protein JetD domain-containing protein [Lentzea flava]|uniref:Wadjet anti-phage system protein JetD domain-containing protein n=1 Tax=Lentzea flava TaxID=103732 RepID=UPI0016703107
MNFGTFEPPLEEIADLSLNARHVLIIENKQSALPIPNWPGVVIIEPFSSCGDLVVL